MAKKGGILHGELVAMQERVKDSGVKLPRPQPHGGYAQPDLPLRHIPAPF